jgi:hypothetical protein
MRDSQAGPSIDANRRPVLAELSRFLENIEILRDPIRGIVPVVNHRYDRLFRE